MPDGTCGVVSFGVKGGRSAAEKFMKGLKVAMIATRCRCTHMRASPSVGYTQADE